MGDFLLTGKPSRYITNHTGQHSLPSLPFNRLPAYWLGLRWGVFTCVGWQVTLCDLVWQATSRSSEDGSLLDLSVHGRGQCPFLQNFRFLILKIRIFVDCLALKFIFILVTKRCPNDRTHGMQCVVVDGGRVVIRSRPFIVSEWYDLGCCSDPRGGWNLPELGGVVQIS